MPACNIADMGSCVLAFHALNVRRTITDINQSTFGNLN